MDVVIKRKPVNIPVLPISAAALVVLLLLTTMRMDRIEANEIGVFVNNISGDISVAMSPGVQIYNGWITDFYKLDNTEQSYRMEGERGTPRDSVRIKTKDGADVSLNVAINYRLVQDSTVIRDSVVPECGLHKLDEIDSYKLKWIRDFARSVARYKFGELTPKRFYLADERNAKAREASDELNRLLNPHGIDVTLVVPGKFWFYEEFETMINDKKAAEQEVKSEESKARAALQAQEREKITAEAAKNVAIARKRGELDKRVLEVEAEAEQKTKEAEAYAYSTKTLADAEFYRAKNEAQAIIAQATAEAEGLSRLANSMAGDGAKNLVKLQYAEALQLAEISGVPYATDPRIQRVDLSGAANALSNRGGQK